MKIQAIEQNLEEPNIEPQVQIQIVDPERYNLILRIPVLARKRARLERNITRRYLQLIEYTADDRSESNEKRTGN